VDAGWIRRGFRRALGAVTAAAVAALATVALVLPAGPVGGVERGGNRITLVFVGDGYTAAQLPLFHRQAAAVWRALLSIQPLARYRAFFRMRVVDVVSPHPGLGPGSPLGMRFGCDGLGRLLCADDAAVRQAVARAPGAVPGPRYVIALADSRRYGGEGGGAGITTLSAGGPDALQVAQHEIGHSIGGLGDEYDTAPGGDDHYPDLSRLDARRMRAARVKWWRWLGAADPTGGTVGAYRSANGLYRPTRDSVMRSLGGTFNLPSREAIIEALYRQVSPVDRAAPAPGTVPAGAALSVRPLGPAGVHWAVDGRPVAGRARRGGTSTLSTRGLAPGTVVTATVRDDTPWVRDETFRRAEMTRVLRWTVA